MDNGFIVPSFEVIREGFLANPAAYFLGLAVFTLVVLLVEKTREVRNLKEAAGRHAERDMRDFWREAEGTATE